MAIPAINVKQMSSELQFLKSVIAEEHAATHRSEQQVVTGSIEENYNSCTNITKNVFQEISPTDKRKGGDSSSKDIAQAGITWYEKWYGDSIARFMQDYNFTPPILSSLTVLDMTVSFKTKAYWAFDVCRRLTRTYMIDGIEASTFSSSVSVKRMKKNYTFYPPNMKSSISTNKPRINDDDASKIGDLFVTMIDPRSGDEVADSQRQTYDTHREDQRLLTSIKNKPKTYKALDSVLRETLGDLLIAFDHVDSNHGDDDERQELALIRYLLFDYHANCIKPVYAILPNERTTYRIP
ncbi:hypothetical protein [Absidia glauca]|uniref:Uncharacterized protein n=1 Tax=Absidia glauca TaxID=4829 RepID=A0A168N0W5_ABSGL|nr:hypothetical protein [Absidia glauca]